MNFAVYVTSTYEDYPEFSSELKKRLGPHLPTAMLLYADSKGGNQMVKQFADENRLRSKAFDVKWDRYGHTAGIIAIWNILKNSERGIGFWNGLSFGCKKFFEMCKRLNRPFDIVRVGLSKTTLPKTPEQQTTAQEQQPAAQSTATVQTAAAPQTGAPMAVPTTAGGMPTAAPAAAVGGIPATDGGQVVVDANGMPITADSLTDAALAAQPAGQPEAPVAQMAPATTAVAGAQPVAPEEQPAAEEPPAEEPAVEEQPTA